MSLFCLSKDGLVDLDIARQSYVVFSVVKLFCFWLLEFFSDFIILISNFFISRDRVFIVIFFFFGLKRENVCFLLK